MLLENVIYVYEEVMYVGAFFDRVIKIKSASFIHSHCVPVVFFNFCVPTISCFLFHFNDYFDGMDTRSKELRQINFEVV